MMNTKERLKDALTDIRVMSENKETPFEKGLRFRIIHFNMAAKKLKLEDMEIHYTEAQKLVDSLMKPESAAAKNKFLKRIKKWSKKQEHLSEEDLHLAITQMGEQLEQTRHKLIEFPHLKLASYKSRSTTVQSTVKSEKFLTRLSRSISFIGGVLANILPRLPESSEKSVHIKERKSKKHLLSE
jgi:hypothetical protein